MKEKIIKLLLSKAGLDLRKVHSTPGGSFSDGRVYRAETLPEAQEIAECLLAGGMWFRPHACKERCRKAVEFVELFSSDAPGRAYLEEVGLPAW